MGICFSPRKVDMGGYTFSSDPLMTKPRSRMAAATAPIAVPQTPIKCIRRTRLSVKNAFNKLLPIGAIGLSRPPNFRRTPFAFSRHQAPEGKQKGELSERENRSKAVISRKIAFGSQDTSFRLGKEFAGQIRL